MSRMMRALVFSVVVVLALGLSAGPATAGKAGPNNVNAKHCQKNGWSKLYTPAGGTFIDEQQCTSYAAKGGQLANAKLIITAVPFFHQNGFWAVSFYIGQAGLLQPGSWVNIAPNPPSEFGPWIDVDANGAVSEPGWWNMDCTAITSLQFSGIAANGVQIVSNVVPTGCPQT